jgi:hypothetical protein
MWTEGDERAKTARSTSKERKSNRAARDDRAKNTRQRNDRDDRSKKHNNMPVKIERCVTPEFDEQFSTYPAAQHPQGLMQEDCFSQGAPILYSCVPVHVAVPTPAAEGMPEWAGYAPTAGYMHDWNAQYQPEVRPYVPQQYMMVQMASVPPASVQQNWSYADRAENGGMDRSR